MSYKPLTSSELAALWTSYIQNSMLTSVLKYFLALVQDPDVVPSVEKIYQLSTSNVMTIENIFTNEGFPIPVGFTENDVNPNAARLFDDTFFLTYIHRMTKVGLQAYSLFQAMVARSDIEQFFSFTLKQLSDMHSEVNNKMLEKGILIRSPYIPMPHTVEFIESKSYFTGFSLFKENRPLNVIEISYLHENIQTNLLGMMLCFGFSQTANLQSVRDFLFRGAEIAKKHVKIFTQLLVDSNVQAPMTWDSQTLASKEAPFSDKLMMFHIQMLVQSGFGNYAMAASASLRKDIATTYSRLALEIAQYAADGAQIMVDHEWLEEPPQMADREAIKNRR